MARSFFGASFPRFPNEEDEDLFASFRSPLAKRLRQAKLDTLAAAIRNRAPLTESQELAGSGEAREGALREAQRKESEAALGALGALRSGRQLVQPQFRTGPGTIRSRGLEEHTARVASQQQRRDIEEALAGRGPIEFQQIVLRAPRAQAKSSPFEKGILESIRKEGKGVPHQQREESEFGGPITGADVELQRRRKAAALRELELEESQRRLAEQAIGEERRGVAPLPGTTRALEREKAQAGVGLTRAQTTELPARTGLAREQLTVSQREAAAQRAQALKLLETQLRGQKEIVGIQAGRRSPQAIIQGLAAMLQRSGIDPATAADMVRNFANEYLDVAAPRGLLSDIGVGGVSMIGAAGAAPSQAEIDEAREVIAEDAGKRPDQVTDAELAAYFRER